MNAHKLFGVWSVSILALCGCSTERFVPPPADVFLRQEKGFGDWETEQEVIGMNPEIAELMISSVFDGNVRNPSKVKLTGRIVGFFPHSGKLRRRRFVDQWDLSPEITAWQEVPIELKNSRVPFEVSLSLLNSHLKEKCIGAGKFFFTKGGKFEIELDLAPPEQGSLGGGQNSREGSIWFGPFSVQSPPEHFARPGGQHFFRPNVRFQNQILEVEIRRNNTRMKAVNSGIFGKEYPSSAQEFFARMASAKFDLPKESFVFTMLDLGLVRKYVDKKFNAKVHQCHLTFADKNSRISISPEISIVGASGPSRKAIEQEIGDVVPEIALRHAISYLKPWLNPGQVIDRSSNSLTVPVYSPGRFNVQTVHPEYRYFSGVVSHEPGRLSKQVLLVELGDKVRTENVKEGEGGAIVDN